jgi:NitT/TauT family transport system substrate-binding protein
MGAARIVIGLPIPGGMAPAYAYFAAASALRFDRDDGLAFDFIYPGDPGTTARALGEGRCQFAPLNTAVGLMARDRGVPLRAVYAMSRRTHRWFAVLPESPIASLPDLRGRTIACDFPDLQPLAEAALAEEGVPRGQVRFVGWRGSGMESRHLVEPLQTGAVDGVFLIDWNLGDFLAEGLRLRRLPSKALDRIRLSSCLWLAAPEVEHDRDLVAGVGRALAKTTVFASANPSAVIQLMWERCPGTKPPVEDRERALRRGVHILQARLETLRLDGVSDARWGAMAREEFVAWQDLLLASGAIGRRLDPGTYFTATFVDRFNDFDPSRVRERARTFSPAPSSVNLA